MGCFVFAVDYSETNNLWLVFTPSSNQNDIALVNAILCLACELGALALAILFVRPIPHKRGLSDDRRLSPIPNCFLFVSDVR